MAKYYVRKSVDNIYFVERDGDKCAVFETENAVEAYEVMYRKQVELDKIVIKMNSLRQFNIALPTGYEN